MTTIDAIDIRGIRGIRQCSLDVAGKWLYVWGENGVGKSSLVDAIEYFFTGHVQSLGGAQSLSLIKHLHHVDIDPSQMSVSIGFRDPATVVVRNQSGYVSAVPVELEDCFRSASRGTFILRRAQLLHFIYDKPSERFSDLEGIMGVQDLDETEKNMQRVSAKMAESVQRLEAQRQDALTQFRIRVGAEASDDSTIAAVLNAKLTSIGVESLHDLTGLASLSEKLMLQAKAAHLHEKRAGQLISVRDAANSLAGTAVDSSLLQMISHAYAELSLAATQERLKVVELLGAAQSVITESPIYASTCPVCEQPIERSATLFRLEARLADAAELSEEAQRLKTSISTLRDLVGVVTERLGSVLNYMTAGVWADDNSMSQGDSARHLAVVLLAELDGATKLQRPLDTDQLITWVKECNRWGEDVAAKAGEMLSAQELSSADRVVLELTSLVGFVLPAEAELERLNQEVISTRAKAEVAKVFFESLKSAKQSVVQSVYNSLQERIESYYRKLHPNEDFANIRLVVDTAHRASATLEMDLLGATGEDPRAYSSEGHLDSLGFVIFLAFAKEFQEQFPVLILDDVVTTIDAQHRSRICDLLCDEFSDWQLVVTTHDRSWFEELKEASRVRGRSDKIVARYIPEWTREQGPVLLPYQSRVGYVAECLKRADTEAAANHGRSQLEFVLKRIAEGTGAEVRYRTSGRYECQELLNAVKGRVNQMSDVSFRGCMLSVLDSLEAVKFIGNFLSHDNPDALGLSVSEVSAFCDAVVGLENAFLCPKCGHKLIYDPSGQQTYCANKQCPAGIVSRFS